MKSITLKTALIALLVGTSIAVFSQKKSNIKTTMFTVSMDCESCKVKIEKNMAFEKGVKAMNVNLEEKIVCITYNTKKNNDQNLIAAFKKLGYEAAVKQTECCKKAGNENCAKKCTSTKDCDKTTLKEGNK
jgi:copper chaperone CopZ